MTFLVVVFRLVMSEFEAFACLCNLFERSDILRSAYDIDSRRVGCT